MGVRTWLGEWPLFRQATGSDPLGRGAAVESPRTKALGPRTDTADEVVKSVCPYCAVGCGQNVYVRDGRVTQIEGDPDSPISRGRLCPKGSASTSLVTSPSRVTTVRYRRPYGTEWEDLDLETATDMIADRVIDARRAGGRTPTRRAASCGARWASRASAARRWTTRRTTSSRSCSWRSARSRSRTRPVYDTAPPSPVWVPGSVVAGPRTSSRTCSQLGLHRHRGLEHGRVPPGGLPVGDGGQGRGAKVIHVDPRFTRTSAVADLHVPFRAGTDIAFLGGLIKYVLDNELYFKEYVATTPTRPRWWARTSSTPRTSRALLGLRPRDRALRPGQLAVRGRYEPGAGSGHRREACGSTASRAGTRSEAPRRPAAPSATRRCSTPAASSRCSSGTSPATPRRWWPGLRHRAEQFRRSREGHRELRPRADDGVVYSVGWTQHTVGAQYIRTARSCRRCWATWAAPGGGIMALRGHASIQGSTDIPTLFNLLPGLPADAARAQHESSTSTSTPTPRRRASGATWTPTWSACSRPAGATRRRRRTTSASTTCRGSTATTAPTPVADMIEGKVVRLLPGRARTRRSGTRTAGCSGSGWPTSTGSSSATCR